MFLTLLFSLLLHILSISLILYIIIDCIYRFLLSTTTFALLFRTFFGAFTVGIVATWLIESEACILNLALLDWISFYSRQFLCKLVEAHSDIGACSCTHLEIHNIAFCCVVSSFLVGNLSLICQVSFISCKNK